MNENIDLTEILKDCPRGAKLYSPIVGVVEFERIAKDLTDPIIAHKEDGGAIYFSADGRSIQFRNNTCILFPNEELRDWNEFKAPTKHKQFKPFEKILIAEHECNNTYAWTADFYSHWSDNLKRHITIGGYHYTDARVIPYNGNEELVGKTVERGDLHENRDER